MQKKLLCVGRLVSQREETESVILSDFIAFLGTHPLDFSVFSWGGGVGNVKRHPPLEGPLEACWLLFCTPNVGDWRERLLLTVLRTQTEDITTETRLSPAPGTLSPHGILYSNSGFPGCALPSLTSNF